MSEEKKPWYIDIKDKLEATNDVVIELAKDVAYMRGELDEMKRHNGRVIKSLATIVVALVTVIGTIIGVLIQTGRI